MTATNNHDQEANAFLGEKIQYNFQDLEWLSLALTHKSYFNENLKIAKGHNEKLEFLGDTVLDMSLSDFLMTQFPDLAEGELSKIRASLVNEGTLADLGKDLQIDQWIKLGKGEKAAGGASKPRLIASTLEAIIGAIFKDSNFEKVDQVIQHMFTQKIANLDLNNHFKEDYKTRLQELAQKEIRQIPAYHVVSEEGPDHEKVFTVVIQVRDRNYAEGQGRTKKQAEQAAARAALEKLEQEFIAGGVK